MDTYPRHLNKKTTNPQVAGATSVRETAQAAVCFPSTQNNLRSAKPAKNGISGCPRRVGIHNAHAVSALAHPGNDSCVIAAITRSDRDPSCLTHHHAPVGDADRRRAQVVDRPLPGSAVQQAELSKGKKPLESLHPPTVLPTGDSPRLVEAQPRPIPFPPMRADVVPHVLQFPQFPDVGRDQVGGLILGNAGERSAVPREDAVADDP